MKVIHHTAALTAALASVCLTTALHAETQQKKPEPAAKPPAAAPRPPVAPPKPAAVAAPPAAVNHPEPHMAGQGTPPASRPAGSEPATRTTPTPRASGPGAPVVSSTFHKPVPVGATEQRAPNGSAVIKRADGSRSDVHDAQRNMDIHHGLTGDRRVVVERADHTRIVAERGGGGYVQHPYSFHGHEFGHRTFYEHGRAYDRFYGRYPYRGGFLEVYAPARFYPVGFYGYAYAPWAAPVPYAWGWAAAPWYGYYGPYYAPYATYAAPNYWLADFVIAASLAAAFEARAAAGEVTPVAPAPWLDDAPLLSEARWTSTARWLADQLVEPAHADSLSATPMSPEVKQAVADEIKAAVDRERLAAQAGAQEDGAPDKNNIATLLSDGQPHVLVAGKSLDLTGSNGQECALTQGDVVKVTGPLGDAADTVSATILASKGGAECLAATTVAVTIADLQDMENHLREQLDDGLDQLQKNQGKNGLPAAPAEAAGRAVPAAFAAAAPPPDASAKNEISQQISAADQAEGDVVASVSAAPAPGANGVSTGALAVGQPMAAVIALLGKPDRSTDLGAKKIYFYPDKKVYFVNGVVDRIE